jgi:hypothetical protein
VVAVWGVYGYGDERGAAVWMHGTKLLPQYPRMILKYSRTVVEHLLPTYRRLEILVSAKYRQSCRWLEWLGFELGQALPVGADGTLFHLAQRRA